METVKLWQQAAEFGLTAFLLVVVLLGCGFALWKIGNRLVDATTISFAKQSDACDQTAKATREISKLARSMHKHVTDTNGKLEVHHDLLKEQGQRTVSQGRAIAHVAAALRETTDNTRAHQYLELARQLLESE